MTSGVEGMCPAHKVKGSRLNQASNDNIGDA